jgi:hypothetical protein
MTLDPLVPLLMALCSHTAADFACRRDHYAGGLPAARKTCFGVWEWARFVGALVFSRGACQHIGRPFGLPQTQVCELTRVALSTHATPVSRILSIGCKLLRQHCPGLRLIVSFADPRHGHHGGIYAGAGWFYLGTTNAEALIRLHGREIHARTVASRYGTRDLHWLQQHVDPAAARVVCTPKHRYVLPLDDSMRRQLAPRVQPYPKRPKEQAPACPAGLGSATLTRPLQFSEVVHVG